MVLLSDPQRCRSITVAKDQVLHFQVSGVAAFDYGAFTLNVNFTQPGSSVGVAKDLGSDAMVSASGDSTGYADGFQSSCGAAGSDVVSLGGGRARIVCPTAAAAAVAAVVPSKQKLAHTRAHVPLSLTPPPPWQL